MRSMRSSLSVAAVLTLWAAMLVSCVQAQQPPAPSPSLTMDVPPGTNPLPIRAPEPKPVPAVDTDKVEPTKDDLKVPFAFVAKIRGAVVTTPTVTLPIGQMLEITFQGTDVEKNGPIKLTCSAEIPDKTIRDNGHYVALTGDFDGDYLLHAAQNSSDASLPPVVAQLWVRIGHGPRPPPPDVDPVDPPKPDPVDPPDATPAAGFRVLIIRDQDSDGTLPLSQLSVIQSTDLKKYLSANCDKESDGSPAWRSWDDSYTDDQVTDGEWLAAYRKALADSKGTLPWVSIYNGAKLGFSGPLPTTEDATLALFKKHGGK